MMATRCGTRGSVRFSGTVAIAGLLAGVAGCGDDPESADAAQTASLIDHQVDCLDADGWSFQGALDADASGDAATPEEAVMLYADRLFDDLNASLEVEGAIGSLVSAGRELVVISAVEAPAGGWVVTTVVACSEVPQPPAR